MKKRKGAIIGFGFISGKGHFPAYQRRSDVEITAIADTCAARRDFAKAQNPSIKTYATAEELLQHENALDFIDISTPPCDHARIALMGLEKGLHVLCEKPLTTSVADAQKLLDAAREMKRVVFPCHNYKHAPVVKTVNEIIASGEIGAVTGLTLNTYRNTHAKGVEEWLTDWRRLKKYSGGGIAMDHGSHTFYLTFAWLGTHPTHVTAKMTNLTPQKWDTEDNFSCQLTFPNGYASSHLTWTAGVRKVMYSIQASAGAVVIDDDDVQVFSNVKGNRRFSIASNWQDASHVNWFNSMFDQFLNCIERDDFVNSELIDAYRCVEIIQTAYESSQRLCLEMPLFGPSRDGMKA